MHGLGSQQLRVRMCVHWALYGGVSDAYTHLGAILPPLRAHRPLPPGTVIAARPRGALAMRARVVGELAGICELLLDDARHVAQACLHTHIRMFMLRAACARAHTHTNTLMKVCGLNLHPCFSAPHPNPQPKPHPGNHLNPKPSTLNPIPEIT
jgi:hypothetical protein